MARTKTTEESSPISFTIDGKRRFLRLGKISKTDRDSIQMFVRRIVKARELGVPYDPATTAWLSGVSLKLAGKLVKAGVLPPEEGETRFLGPLVKKYIAGRTDIKPRSVIIYTDAQRNLVEYFGEDRLLSSITKADAAAFHRWLLHDKGLAKATVAKRIGTTKMFFRYAIDARLVTENPFCDISSQMKGNPRKLRFIDAKDIYRVIEACPSHEWRLLVALARFGGLRVPSEPCMLKWEDIDWGRSTIRVTSPKTAHHEDCGIRTIPIFPELRPYLLDTSEIAQEEGSTVYVFNHIKALVDSRETQDWKNANLRTTFLKIIKRAGLKSWPRPWQNLRATRDTELRNFKEAYKVDKWIGHSDKVAEEFYLQITDEDYLEAANTKTTLSRKAQQYQIETICTEQKCGNLSPSDTTPYETVQDATRMKIHPTGFEPVTSGSVDRCSVQLS